MKLGAIGDSLLLVVIGAVAKAAIDLLLDFLRRINPKVEYSVTDAVPFKVGEAWYGSYRVRIANRSRKKIEDVTFHFTASDAKLSVVKIYIPHGVDPKPSSTEKELSLSIPYLKRGEEIELQIRAESNFYIPESLQIAVSSPHDFKSVSTPYGSQSKPRFSSVLTVVTAASIGIAVAMVSDTVVSDLNQRDIIVSAASQVGLPQVAETYITANDPAYYDLGDFAYALASSTQPPQEVDKYRNLILLTLQMAPGIQRSSQANLYYDLGRLDLLAKDESQAIADFQKGLQKSRSTVADRAKLDQRTNDFLVRHGLL